jgi:hypothetical protein
MATGTWEHIALVRNSTNVKLYKNGVAILSDVVPGTVGTPEDWVIGGQTGARYFNGEIDDLRITKDVARYTADFTPPGQLPTN